MQLSLNEYYAKHNLHEQLSVRQAIKSLVEEWWDDNGLSKPPLPDISNIGLIARAIATFRYEDAIFVVNCEKFGLKPVWCEFTGDQMSSASRFKCSLLHVTRCTGIGRNNGLKVQQAIQLANINCCINKPLNMINTSQGSLVDFHHQHQDKVFFNAVRSDYTAWLKQMGGASAYYEAYLSMFIAHAVLFEDYHGGEESGKSLDNFFVRVFKPAWQAVTKRFGVVPLMFLLPWHENYRFYPADQNWREHGVLQKKHLQ